MKVVPSRIEGRFISPSTTTVPRSGLLNWPRWKLCGLVGQAERLASSSYVVHSSSAKAKNQCQLPEVSLSLPPPPLLFPAFLFLSKPIGGEDVNSSSVSPAAAEDQHSSSSMTSQCRGRIVFWPTTVVSHYTDKMMMMMWSLMSSDVGLTYS